MAPTLSWTDLPTGKHALVVLTFVGGVLLHATFSRWVEPGSDNALEPLWPALTSSMLLFGCSVLLLLRIQLSLRSIVLSSVIATLVFAAANALLFPLTSGGPQDLIGSVLTRILYYFMAAGDIAVAFFLCMTVGAVVRFLHLNPERKTLRYR